MNKFNTILAAALLLMSSSAFAADCTPLAGHYTIGAGENADFPTFTDAITALKCGVSGPVTFTVESGTYNEKVVVPAITGASAMNGITFESGSDAVITYATGDATLVINGASYITFENITIDHKAAVYGNCLKVDNRSTNLRFKSVIFNGVEVARPGANNATVYFTSNVAKSDIVIEDCEVNNGSTGIYKGGVSGSELDNKTAISGTLFFNQFETGLAMVNEDAPVISNNVFSTLSTYLGYKAMSLDNISNNVIISNNIVNAANGSVGLAMNNCIGSPTALGQINNNSIAVGGKTETYGISLTGTTDNQVINFNRVKLTLDGPQGNDQAFYKNAGSGNNVNMMNNIFYDLNTGGYTILGNTYKDALNQLPSQSNPALSVSANGIMIEKVTPIK